MTIASNESNQVKEAIRIIVREPLPEDISGSLLLAEHKKEEKPQQKPHEVTALAEQETQNLLKRLPEIQTQDITQDEKDCFVREPSLKAPVTAETVLQAFPPADDRHAKPAELIEEEKKLLGSELSIVRYLPEGIIEDASVPRVSITFSQPMIAVSTVDQIERLENVPVSIEPLPKKGGKFKWLGTKTLVYEPEYRFDMSTKYTVTIKAGTTSAIGGVLKNDVSFSFETPRLNLQNQLPKYHHSFPMDEFPIYYLEFDQEIDPSTVLSYVELDSNAENAHLKLIHDGRTETIAVKEYVSNLLKEHNLEKKAPEIYHSYIRKLENAPKGRHLWFTAKCQNSRQLENLTFSIKQGLKGLEGPLPTEKPFIFKVKNYPPFKITNLSQDHKTLPLQPLQINFSNTIDLEKFDETTVTVEPAIVGMNLIPNGSSLTIGGKTKGRTTYKVTLNENTLQDVWGQKLTGPNTFSTQVGSASQSLQALQKGVIVLDPTINTKPSFSVVTMNLKAIHCRVFQVEPEEYKDTTLHLNVHTENEFQYPGKQVFDATINTNGQEDEPCDTDIDLSLFLQYPKENLGHLFVVVEPDEQSWKSDWKYRPIYSAWIQATKIGLDAIYDSSDSTFYFWANSLVDGSIIKENISVKCGDVSATPDSVTGIGTMKKEPTSTYVTVIASQGNDKCFIPNIYINHYRSSDIAYQIFNDRGLYKPGETVSLKGIVRRAERNESKKIFNLTIPKPKEPIEFTVVDSRSSKYHSGTVSLSENGTFDLTFQVPDNVNLGEHNICFTGFTHMYHYFKVQEFRTPEFTSQCNVVAGNYVVNGSAALCTTRAEYYSGGAISGGKCSYTISQSHTSYSPPNRREYSFGEEESSVYSHFFRRGNKYLYHRFLPSTETFEGTTDMNGEHQIALKFEETERAQKVPVSVSIESTVQDINRQTISASTSLLVHPCKYYCGIKFSKQFTKANSPVNVSLITTTIDGELVPNFEMELVVTTFVDVKKGYKYEQEKVEVMKNVVKSSGEGPVEFPAVFETGGSYEFHVTIRDKESGLTNFCSKSLFVTGGKNTQEERVGTRLRQKQLLLVPDKKEYSVGDVATILIQSQIDGHLYGVLNTELDGIVGNPIPIEIDPSVGFAEYSFTVTKDHIPQMSVSVEMNGSESKLDAFGNTLENEPKKPAFATGSCTIYVSKLSHALTVEAVPEKTFLTPGSATSIHIKVQDALTQQPMPNSEVCVIAVDEAVLALSNHAICNPLDVFIIQRSHSYRSRYSIRNHVFVKSLDGIVFSDEDVHLERRSFFGARGGRLVSAKSATFAGSITTTAATFSLASSTVQQSSFEGMSYDVVSSEPISIRSNFNPLAVFSPRVITNENGEATVKLTLPDNLTKYRITAVALNGESHFGMTESNMVAQLPLNIRPSLPRFLNFGDKAEFSCVLQNQTPIDLEVHIATRFTNLGLLDESKRGLKVKIPALQRCELSFPMTTQRVGIAKFQIAVSIANHEIKFADAVEKEIRVFTPSTTEGFATYGEIDSTNTSNSGAVVQPIRAPERSVDLQFGGLRISTSSTALSTLTDAFLYLYTYPFDCCEQVSSKILTIVALKDVLKAFNVPELPTDFEITKTLEDSIKVLESRQHSSGGYSFWANYSYAEVSPYITCHVAHAFARAKIAGYQVSETTISKLLEVLKTIENYCRHYSDESLHSIKAYAYYCSALLGDYSVKQLTENLYTQVKKSNLESLAWVVITLYLCNSKTITSTISEIIHDMCQKVNETAQTAHFVTSYGDVQSSRLIMLHSDRRTDGICLEALLTITPENSLIPKLVKGLLAHKKKGRWSNTQENAFILLALNTYFRTFEGVTPNFCCRMWLGEEYCGEQQFLGRSRDEKLVNIPMKYLVEDQNNNEEQVTNTTKTLVISKEGVGRLYYRVGLDYTPKNLILEPIDYGFQVNRIYEAVTPNAQDHVQFDATKNVWKFKAGELIRVKVSVTNTSRRYHVALVDMLPAGLEPINPELKGAQASAVLSAGDANKNTYCWWTRPWYEHCNIRDERVETFASLLSEGIHEFNYVARATSVGSFVIPPAKVEEMYCPELFGRSGTLFAEVFE
ncbi:hypothetical protein C9374_010557 [Naegleria lovaniensis]|uniref:Uncharacterized protein n=1 Tax=Naegleria lovaniensis TaxID=51637 RepID=A0AA88GGM5_NAELO|nr:uncharacterized protein C9374_010557 [Naegleria lovaniensis]KAG2374813.1 hypothetical protein C9374_010557 [Naegleria lovaniensis]